MSGSTSPKPHSTTLASVFACEGGIPWIVPAQIALILSATKPDEFRTLGQARDLVLDNVRCYAWLNEDHQGSYLMLEVSSRAYSATPQLRRLRIAWDDVLSSTASELSALIVEVLD